ncbi:hypothetical protein EP331_12465 [bacterium]|nr:MAG: hypothetical protein EP331_12465 [bacterium]
MSKLGVGVAAVLLSVSSVQAQEIPAYAFKNVTIHTHDGKTVEKASIVWRNGSIEAVGTNVTVPFDAKTVDGGDSLHIYPGFIDGYSEIASPDMKRDNSRVERPGEPPYDKAGIEPQRSPFAEVDFKKKDVSDAKKAGFTMAAIGLKGMMLPGKMDVYYLAGDDAQANLLESDIAQKGAFKNSRSVYPSTLMGTIVKFRQLWADASALQVKQKNYQAEPSKFSDPGRDEVLEALYPVINKEQPLFFEVDEKEDVERVIKLKNELGFNLVIVSAKQAFRYADLLKKEKVPVLVSLDLPKEPEWKAEKEKAKKDTTKVEKPVPADVQAFRDKQWAAYADYVKNLKSLYDAGLNPGFTSYGLKWKDFAKTIETLKEMGLSESDLLKSLTVNTAAVLGLNDKVGKLEKGFSASFTVTSKPMFEKKSKQVYQVVKGELNDVN